MTDFLLYSGPSSVTGPRLANYLGIDSGTEVPRGVDRVIRWGNSFKSARGAEVIQPGDAISDNVDKFQSLQTMEDHGVPVPSFARNPSDVMTTGEGTLVGRDDQHSGGTDVEFYENPYDARDNRRSHDYFVNYIRAESEFRVHVYDGEIIKKSQKVYRGEGNPPDHPMTRNYDDGWHFLNPRDNPNGFIQARAAVEALGLDFGAVDMVFDSQQNPYVLEVNTAPSADPPTLEEWGQAIADDLGINPAGMDNVNFPDEDDNEQEDSGGLF